MLKSLKFSKNEEQIELLLTDVEHETSRTPLENGVEVS